MSPVKHVFVLMMENRSFDHIFGYSGLTGRDAQTGAPTEVEGLLHADGTNVDPRTGQVVRTSPTAAFVDPTDVEHEFLDVLAQLCGPDAVPASGRLTGAYPPVNNSGFLADYVSRVGSPVSAGPLDAPTQPDLPMQCFDPSDLPVLMKLAREFAVCDHWFAALPGPTWPNRFWLHGASPTTERVADSPSTLRIEAATTTVPFRYAHGSIYDRLQAKGLKFNVYTASRCAQIYGIAGPVGSSLTFGNGNLLEFIQDLPGADDGFASYTFIEPHPGSQGASAICGSDDDENDMHPPSDVRKGEEFIRFVYETIRSSPIWPSSALFVMFDEHGGYYDHLRPAVEDAPPPCDGPPDPLHGFAFDRRGVRVPALVISPLIPRNTIDHTLYDHTSVLATAERLFGLVPLTHRDGQAKDLLHLFSLPTPRTDTPATLDAVDHHGVNPASDPTWVGDFLGLGHDQVLTFRRDDRRWWLRAYRSDAVSWMLVSHTATFGDTGENPTWVGDFRGDGHDQVLFYSPGDQNWWLGTCTAAGAMTWTKVCNTSRFGDTQEDPTWIGDFRGLGRAQVLFYSPGDQNWWLGTLTGDTMTWQRVCNTHGFGNTQHDPTWIGDFTGAGHAQVLFYSPGDHNWWLGTCATTGTMTWKMAGNSSGFGNTAAYPTWIGDFGGAGHDQVLFYSPGDHNWWLGTCTAAGAMTWTLAGNKANPSPATTQVGDFTGTRRKQVRFGSVRVMPGTSPVKPVLGSITGGRFSWSPGRTTLTTFLGDRSWLGDFTGAGRTQVLGYEHATGRWPLAFYDKADFTVTRLRSRIADILAGNPRPVTTSQRLLTAFVANNSGNALLVCSSDDGTTWSDNHLVAGGESTRSAPALAAFGGKLWLGFVANNAGSGLLVCSSTEGKGWTPNRQVGHSSKTGPALAAFGDRLHVAFVSNDPLSRLLVSSTGDGVAWTGSHLVAGGESTTFAPALAGFAGRLWLTFVANNPGNRLLVCSSADGVNWTPNALLGGQSSKTAPALAVFGGRLYVAFVANDPSNRVLICSTSDGVTWTGNSLVAGGESTKAAPTLAAFGGRLWLTFVANNPGNRLLVCSTADGTTWTSNTPLGTQSSQTAPALVVAPRLS